MLTLWQHLLTCQIRIAWLNRDRHYERLAPSSCLFQHSAARHRHAPGWKALDLEACGMLVSRSQLLP